MNEVKKCTDCKHYVPALENFRFSRCGRTNLTGEPMDGNSPSYERRGGPVTAWMERLCGRSGRFWEQKP